VRNYFNEYEDFDCGVFGISKDSPSLGSCAGVDRVKTLKSTNGSTTHEGDE
jgi:hypothetical protein